MSAETRKVLEMLAEGKITSDDAERLLDKLASKPAEEGGNGPSSGNGTSPKDRVPGFKFLRVMIDKGDGHDVNVKVPLSFLRSGVKLLGMLPPKAAKRLNERGINLDFLSELHGDELDEALNTLHVDIESEEGQHVRVFCE